MTSIPETPHGADLDALREEIDELKAVPEEELVNPLPTSVEERTPTPHSTDALGTEKWDESASDETLDQQ